MRCNCPRSGQLLLGGCRAAHGLRVTCVTCNADLRSAPYEAWQRRAAGLTIHATMLRDRHGRDLGSLRVSVTDRCNLRCRYCMPEDDYVWLPRESILTFEEIGRLVRVFAGLGVTKVRVTGGEPLLRQDLPELVSLLGDNEGIRDLALTTNGMLLSRYARALREAGLGRVTVSLDTLRPERFREHVRSYRHADVLQGIDAAISAGFDGVKVNAVVLRGFNDDELGELVAFGREVGAEIRFIEYMDVGGATQWRPEDVVSKAEILQRIERELGAVRPVRQEPNARAPADRYQLEDGTVFGVIASTTDPFCRDCDRSRLTADGVWLTCLYASRGMDLRDMLRSGASDDELARRIGDAWRARTDRGAEERLAVGERGPLYQVEGLRADPHREMHTRGG